ncbi:MAG: hypothetical protein HQL65_07845 [Magnetococcales bacterium]|nr:hypothetical protein [Magnetococcales bacterium]
MIYDVLINMPTETNFALLAESVQNTIHRFQGEWPSGVMPGTRSVNGRRITHALIDMEDPDPLATLEETIAGHDLDWLVLAMQAIVPDADGHTVSQRSVPASMLTYLADLDGQGTRPTSLTSLHRYAGHPAWELASS